jgi:putative drug exporter of the RND superfamily
MVVVPATMELLGELNWWMPPWLDRVLPRLSIERRGEPTPAMASPAAWPNADGARG